MSKKKAVKDKTISIDMLHYKANRLSFWLILLTIALNIAMFLIIYKTTDCTPNIQLGIDLLVNVIIMLVCFLAAEKTKHYSKSWGIVSIIMGHLQVVRIFWIPLYYFLQFRETGKGLGVAGFVWCAILLLLSGISMIIAGIINNKKCNTRDLNEPLLNKEEAKKDVRT